MNWTLANTFLTKHNKVGMQWQLLSGNNVVNQLTIWKDKVGKTHYTCAKRVPQDVLDSCKSTYRATSHHYIVKSGIAVLRNFPKNITGFDDRYAKKG